MITLKLKRIARQKGYTIGRLYADEKYFCDTLEPQWRDYRHGEPKISGKSAIPEGCYPVVITKSMKLRAWLPLLIGVPCFTAVRIHAGNTPADTRGCILVGENKVKGQMFNSSHTLQRLLVRLTDRPDGEPISLTVE
jgi:hypothetical protein